MGIKRTGLQFESIYDKTMDFGFVEDSDQPEYPLNLISVFAVYLIGS